MSTFNYSTLDTTIRRALISDDAENKTPYLKAFTHARRWYENEYAGAVEKAYGHRTVKLVVEVDRTAALPDDYVEWSMVGLRRGEHVHNLLYNPALVAVPVLDGPNGPSIQAPAYEYQYTNCLEAFGVDCLTGYGYPALRPGEFTVQRAERQLLVSSQISPGTQLLLHYLSDDAPCGQSTIIHPLAESWLEFYILDYLNRKRAPGLAATYRADCERARLDYLQKRSPFQLDDIYAAMRNILARHG
jgi:hypothetical protein